MAVSPVDTFVQVAQDGTGKLIRNLRIVAMQEDGTLQLVHMQAVAVVDPVTGEPLDISSLASKIDESNHLLRMIVRGLEALANTSLEGE